MSLAWFPPSETDQEFGKRELSAYEQFLEEQRQQRELELQRQRRRQRLRKRRQENRRGRRAKNKKSTPTAAIKTKTGNQCDQDKKLEGYHRQ